MSDDIVDLDMDVLKRYRIDGRVFRLNSLAQEKTMSKYGTLNSRLTLIFESVHDNDNIIDMTGRVATPRRLR